MKVPLYILGFLLRYGPQHGYLLKQHIDNEASDFAVIRTANLYYHLERLEQAGHVSVTVEKDGRRPDRQVFEITEAGKQHFFSLLEKAAETLFQGEYLFDAALYFAQYLAPEILNREFERSIEKIAQTVAHIRSHQAETMKSIPEHFGKLATAIFNHHRYHYEAELKWLEETKVLLNE